VVRFNFHTDLCGGSIDDELDAASLSRISLRWMVQQCLNVGTNIQLDEANLDLVSLVDEQIARTLRYPAELVTVEDIIAVLKTIKKRNPPVFTKLEINTIDITVSPSDGDGEGQWRPIPKTCDD